MRRAPLSCAAGAIAMCIYAAFSLGSGTSAQGPSTFPDPNLTETNGCKDPAVCGKVSPLIPMQSTEAVHMGLVWKRNSDTPKILYHARFPEYTPNDVADPAQIEAVLDAPRNPDTGLSLVDNGANDFNRSLRDVLHPSFRDGSNPTADSFQRLTYGGYLLRQGLSQSVPTRIVANRTMERQLLFDPSHPDALKTTGKFHTAVLDEADFALNRKAFAENGFSKGNFYNTYCNARVTLSDGKVYVFGGHDMQSNNGLFKVNIFDPETEEWVRRTPSCTLTNWRSDPFGTMFFENNPEMASNLDAHFQDCSPRIQENTQASDPPSDQKYARWYPSAAPLPNDWVLVLGGFDQDSSVGPDPDRGTRVVPPGQPNAGAPATQQDTAFNATRVNIVVPEVYDPVSDSNIALENARMAFPLYPQMEVVRTGPGKEDWKLCTFNGEIDYGSETVPGGTQFGTPAAPEQARRQFSVGTTWCLDVIGAMRDPKRHLPARNHWTKMDTAKEVRPYCCATASLVELNEDGETVSHKWLMISGNRPTPTPNNPFATTPTGTVESIDFTDPMPKWTTIGAIGAPLATPKAVLLPNGKVLIGHGRAGGACTVTEGSVTRPCTFSEREGHYFQMLDPITGAVTRLARTTVSRGLHGTATLLPDATVIFAGENREALIRPDDPSFPMAASWAPDGELRRGDPDQGVPVGQIFSPPYLFTAGGAAADRPMIVSTPRTIAYRGHFDIKVQGRSDQIRSVALLRSDHNTHSLTAGDRHVKLSFRAKGDASKGELRIVAPKLPAQAVPGIYMLFVLDANGVPSMGKQVRLMPETRGSTTAFR